MENINEKFMLEDFLGTQKHVTATYNTWAGECVNAPLKNKLMDLLGEEHNIQQDLFTVMNKKGYYPVKPAEKQDIDMLKQKFS